MQHSSRCCKAALAVLLVSGAAAKSSLAPIGTYLANSDCASPRAPSLHRSSEHADRGQLCCVGWAAGKRQQRSRSAWDCVPNPPYAVGLVDYILLGGLQEVTVAMLKRHRCFRRRLLTRPSHTDLGSTGLMNLPARLLCCNVTFMALREWRRWPFVEVSCPPEPPSKEHTQGACGRNQAYNTLTRIHKTTHSRCRTALAEFLARLAQLQACS